MAVILVLQTPANIYKTYKNTGIRCMIMEVKITEWGSDKDVYTAGEKATLHITIQNKGADYLNGEKFEYSIKRKFLWFWIKIASGSKVLYEPLNPKQTKTLTHTLRIPKSWHGIPAKGEYDVSFTVTINMNKVGTYSKKIKVN